MRIGIDGYNLAMAKGTGVATYGIELAHALHGLGHEVHGVFGVAVPPQQSLRQAAFFDAVKRPPDPARKTNRYQRAARFLKAFRASRPYAVPLDDGVEKQSFAETMPAFDALTTASNLFDKAFTTFGVTGRLTRIRLPEAIDVMHWTYPVPVVAAGIPNVYTFHDIVPLKLPYTTLDNKVTYGKIAAACVGAAAQICTVSDASRRDIVEHFGIDPARVTNTYQTSSLTTLAADLEPEAAAQAIEGIFGLPHRGYFLYFGAIAPKKNVGRLIEAYLSMQSATPLVIVGARAWQSERELQLIKGGEAGGVYRGHRGQMIMQLDYLSRDLLAKMVMGAKAVVFPSLYEGFGLPVLEAMQLGTPVITSTTSSLPEVAGEAGILVDPYDVSALQAAMRRVDADPALCRAMAERGRAQATLFARERYQERLTALYRTAMTPR